MSARNIDYLIKKYDKPYVSGEIRSSETNKLLKRNQRRLIKHTICDELLRECEFLKLTAAQKDFVHYLVDRFSDSFKKLHGKSKKEAIILAFIFYVKKLTRPRLKIYNYSISKKYGLTPDVFTLILCRMCDDFIKSSPIPCFESTSYDHEILSKNGGKL